MTQTIGGMNTVEAVIEATTDGSTWTNIGGTANMVTPEPMTAQSGQAHTFEGQYPIVRAGKYNVSRIRVRALYTEIASETYALLHAMRDVPGRPFWLRWTPGGYNGEWRYKTANSAGQTAAGRLVEFPLPPTDASDATPT